VNLFEATLRDLLASAHRARFRATGDSMYPAIRNGDAVEIAPCDVSELRRGDIVLAALPRGLTLHRVVRISPRGIVTRGDNSLCADSPFGPSQVLGRAIKSEEITGDSRPFDALVKIIRAAVRFARRLQYRFRPYLQ
jgi:signal peptidase I